MKRTTRIVLLAAVALTFVVSAGTASADQAIAVEKCPPRSDLPQEDVIAGCLAAIHGGKLATNDVAEVYLNLGAIYFLAQEYQPAIDALNQSVRLRPDWAIAYETRGAAYMLAGQYALAMADVDESIRLNPDYAAAFDLRGAIFEALKQYERSIADEDRAVTLEPNRAEAYNNRGYSYLRLGKNDEAIEDFNTTILLQPGHVLALKGRCWARARTGRELDKALADCTQSIEANIDNPDNKYTLEERCLVNLRLERFKDASADADEALKRDPKLSGALYIRGLAKRKTGDTAGSDTDIAAAKTIDPKIADTYAGYGVTP